MSGAQTPTTSEAQRNVLFNPLAVPQAQELQNRLAGQQIDLSNANQAQVQQAAAGLLSGFPDEASRAAAYPRVVGMLQSQGFAKQAPAQYPGEAALRAIVNMGIPAKDLYSSGALMTPAQQQLLGQGNTVTPTSTTSATAPPAAAPSGAGATIGQRQNNPGNLTFAGQPGASPGQGNRFAAFPDMPTGVAATANQLALYQEQHGINTVRGAVTRWVSDPKADLTSYTADVAKALGVGPDDPIDLTNPDVQAKFIQAQFPHESAGGGYVLNPADVAKGVQMAAANRGRTVQAPGTAVAAAAPPTAPPGGVAARTGGTDTAGPAAGTTPPTAAPGATIAATPSSAAPQFTYNGRVGSAPDSQGGVHWADGNYGSAPAGVAPVPVAAAAVPASGAPASSTPPAPATAPAQPPAAAPSSTSRLPEASTIPTGQNSAPYRQAMQLQQQAMQYDAVAGTNPAFAKHAADLRLQAAGILQAGATVSAQQDGRPGTLDVVTGKFTPYTPLPSPRFSQPTIDPATGKPAIAAVSGSGTQYFPIPASPAQADYENMKAAYTGDIPTVKTIAESGRAAQASALQLNELADVIKGVQSGGILPEFRAKVAALMEANGAKPETIQAMTGMSSGSDAQVLQKLAVATIGASAKSDLGSNVGVESLNLYAGANPGMDKLQDANKRVTNMIRVAREQIESYSLGAQQHFNQNQSTMLHTPPGQVPDYHPLSEYNEKWQAQNNPQIGAAAIGILNGDGFDKWAARAGPAEALNAVRLAARIDPNVQIPVKGGGFKSAQEVLSHGTGQ